MAPLLSYLRKFSNEKESKNDAQQFGSLVSVHVLTAAVQLRMGTCFQL